MPYGELSRSSLGKDRFCLKTRDRRVDLRLTESARSKYISSNELSDAVSDLLDPGDREGAVGTGELDTKYSAVLGSLDDR